MRQRRGMIEHVPHKPKTRNNDYPTTILYADNKKTNIKTKRDESRPYGSRPKIGPFLGSKKGFHSAWKNRTNRSLILRQDFFGRK